MSVTGTSAVGGGIAALLGGALGGGLLALVGVYGLTAAMGDQPVEQTHTETISYDAP